MGTRIYNFNIKYIGRNGPPYGDVTAVARGTCPPYIAPI